MTTDQVAEILGPPETTHDVADSFATQPDLAKKMEGRTQEIRIFDNVKTMAPSISYEEGLLLDIDFAPNHTSLSLRGVALIGGSRQKVIDRLTDMSETVFETFDGFLFLDFGLSMSSAANAKTNPPINVFARGSFDDYIAEDLADDMGRYIKGGP